MAALTAIATETRDRVIVLEHRVDTLEAVIRGDDAPPWQG
jgi:BMFP domain-containing protein YqiC